MMNLREINWFVAEKVMNWHVWENEDGELMVTKGYGCYSRCPSFSTNIADAWQVVEKMRLTTAFTLIDVCDEDYNTAYMAKFSTYDGNDLIDFTAYSETAQLAICLAALKAVGVDMEVLRK